MSETSFYSAAIKPLPLGTEMIYQDPHPAAVNVQW